MLSDFPSWKDQLIGWFNILQFKIKIIKNLNYLYYKGIEQRAPELMLAKYDDLSLRLINELEKYWLLWNSKFRVDFKTKEKKILAIKQQ